MERRLFLTVSFFVLLFFSVVIRLFYWQIVSSDKLKSWGEKQVTNSLIIAAERGRIFASDGNPLVINSRAFQVFAEPYKIKDEKKVSKLLSDILEISESTLTSKLQQSSLKWVSLADKISDEKAQIIKKYDLPGVGFFETSKRYYPEASMAAHLLGFVGKNYKGEDNGGEKVDY